MQANNPDPNTAGKLTPREREILALAQSGMTNKQIAQHLGITRNAVRFHLKDIHSKLETGSERSVLARGWARGLGLIGFPVAKLGVPVTVATFATGISLIGLAAYQALPGEDALALPLRFEGSVLVDGRYPNGCPAEFSAGTMTLEDFAYGGTTIEELRALNPLYEGYTTNQAKIRVPYNPNQTCAEAGATSAGAPVPFGTPPSK